MGMGEFVPRVGYTAAARHPLCTVSSAVRSWNRVRSPLMHASPGRRRREENIGHVIASTREEKTGDRFQLRGRGMCWTELR